jgi:hypothetical protein
MSGRQARRFSRAFKLKARLRFPWLSVFSVVWI